MSIKEPSQERGQSLILVAVALVSLVIFVAITVDVSNAYYHRRTAQNAADAAALAGAQELGFQINLGSYNDSDIKAVMNDFAERNDIPDTNEILADAVNDNVIGYYLDSRDVRIGDVGAGSVPKRAVGIEAVALITAPTYFGGIVGFDGYPVQAEAAVMYELACTGDECMLPIAIRDYGFTDGTFSSPARQCFNMWDGYGPGNFGWLNWSLQSQKEMTFTYSCQDDYLRSLGYDGNLPDDCSAQCLDINLDPDFCNRVNPLHIKVGDYVGGAPGVMNAAYIHDWLDLYITEELLAKIVVYDDRKGKGGCGKLGNKNGFTYRVAGFACFYVTGYRLSTGTGQEVRCDAEKDLQTLNCGSAFSDNLYCDPRSAVDYPLNCETEDGDACDYETGDFNRITGFLVPCTGGNIGKCSAVGNLLAPMLYK